ncbi:MAG: hypothetical protein PHV36_02875 [Elusimicrobiales bacterium]|nr:hypothetical protein [Elusimicrobiales bacterium]
MENIVKVMAAGLLFLNLIPCSSAAGSDVLRSAGLGVEAVEMPEVPLPAAGSAGQPESGSLDLFRGFGRAEMPWALQLSGEKGAGGLEKAPVVSIKLEPIRNAYLKPAITFTTGAGTKVYVSGTKAANCPDGGNSCEEKEKFFLVLTTGRSESYFVRAGDIINWGIFYSGSKTVTIDGEKYVVKILADATSPEESVLEVKGPRGVALSATLKKIGEAVAARGVDVRLGRSYKLAYGNEIVQGPGGAKFTSKLLLLMLPFPVVDATTYFIFNASDIKPSGVTFPAFERSYSFRLQGGILDISKI